MTPTMTWKSLSALGLGRWEHGETLVDDDGVVREVVVRLKGGSLNHHIHCYGDPLDALYRLDENYQRYVERVRLRRKLTKRGLNDPADIADHQWSIQVLLERAVSLRAHQSGVHAKIANDEVAQPGTNDDRFRALRRIRTVAAAANGNEVSR